MLSQVENGLEAANTKIPALIDWGSILITLLLVGLFWHKIVYCMQAGITGKLEKFLQFNFNLPKILRRL